ncbi:MAG: SDR family oxidoreductase [Candidatus Omnitrophica bacterium]|nr:SDR family oxidoreductase [Candidatus Omnitrophota bacterium]MBU4479174.1 SDR family oxidoreductase [Candidatus Omnitrophota bacterium]MCG2703976.1 SDR family oxidoreductase [Candidatus Omnitrophota bacterium]
MSKYLVTGGAGFIGSHIVEELLKKGESVVILDNFSSGKRENLAFANELKNSGAYELIEGDIQDKAACEKACAGVDYILHQAALRSVPKSMEAPHDYNAVNIDGILNILEAARDCRVRRVVFASSSSVYGDTDVFPQREDAYPLLISPYALSKLTGEFYCRIFSKNFGVETVSLRYFNVFGPRQALDDEYAVVIPKFITCILDDEQPPIFGNGKQSRDFTFVKNVVQANLLAAVTPGVSGEVFNVACGADNSVLELIRIINEIAGKSVAPKHLPVRKGDVFKTLADISKIRKLLNYNPRYDFAEAVKITFEWFKNQG